MVLFPAKVSLYVVITFVTATTFSLTTVSILFLTKARGAIATPRTVIATMDNSHEFQINTPISDIAEKNLETNNLRFAKSPLQAISAS